jgi:hypothetical protein
MHVYSPHPSFNILNFTSMPLGCRLASAAAGSLAMGCVIFLVLGLGSVAAFGPAVNSNILNNLSASGMAPLIGSQAASVSDQH